MTVTFRTSIRIYLLSSGEPGIPSRLRYPDTMDSMTGWHFILSVSRDLLFSSRVDAVAAGLGIPSARPGEWPAGRGIVVIDAASSNDLAGDVARWSSAGTVMVAYPHAREDLKEIVGASGADEIVTYGGMQKALLRLAGAGRVRV